MSIEQLIRNLLSKAMADGLIESESDPQDLTPGDLTGMTEIVEDYLESLDE